MKRLFPIVVSLLLLGAAASDAQVKWMVGARLGLDIGIYSLPSAAPVLNFYGLQTNNSTSSSSTNAGLLIGPTAEVIFAKQFAVTTELDIITTGGTPIIWANDFKVYFPISGSQIKPYANAGFALEFFAGGPYFGVSAGGGALFPVAKNLYIPADLQFGIFFPSYGTGFFIGITSGVRYVF